MDDQKNQHQRIILYVACGLMGVGLAYLFLVTFVPIPSTGLKHSETIVGFMLGVILAGPIGYYWGSSAGSAAKSSTLDEVIKKPTEPPEGQG